MFDLQNHILHRDMKAANLLISNSGSLRIADFGLARSYDRSVATVATASGSSRGKERRYTNCVVTRWYRPPELLLGARNYGGEIDMWGVGYANDPNSSRVALMVLRCVLGEMFLRHPILPGNSDLDQLEKIWQMCGTPNQHTWPNFDTLPGCEGVKHHNQHPKRLKSVFEQSVTTISLLSMFPDRNLRDLEPRLAILLISCSPVIQQNAFLRHLRLNTIISGRIHFRLILKRAIPVVVLFQILCSFFSS